MPRFIFFILLLLVVGCDLTGGDEAEDVFALGTVAAEADGSKYEATNTMALLADSSRYDEGLTIAGTGTNGGLFAISLYPFEGEGTYAINQSRHAARIDLSKDSDARIPFLTNLGGEGAVEVVEFGEKEIQGTFGFTASDEAGNEVQVSEGNFRAEILQDHQAQVCGEEVFMVVEQMPEPIGGMASLQERIEYPEFARKAGIEGRVFVQFSVGPQGEVFDPVVQRGVHKTLDAEALRVIHTTAFEPGLQKGDPVCVRMSLPVTFRLQ